MKHALNFLVVFVLFILVISCNKDDDPEIQKELTGKKTEFTISENGDSGISGNVVFEEYEDFSTKVTLQLSGTSDGNSYPAHIHTGTAIDSKGIEILLNNVDGSTGKSETDVIALIGGNNITYSELIAYDGNVKIHRSDSELGTIVARGDLGTNQLTGESETFEIVSLGNGGISGFAKFEERESGVTLVTLTVEGTTDGVDHPAHIHNTSAIEGGPIVISLSNVSGSTGLSITDISVMDDGTEISFEELIDFNGHVVIHQNTSDFAMVASGDIGQNAFTSESEEYSIISVSSENVSGIALFQERKSGATLVTLTMQGTSSNVDHPAHIHVNSAMVGGGIVINLNNVNGSTGISAINISAMNDGTAISYKELLDFDGHIVVHKNLSNFGKAATGDIGQNTVTGNSEEYTLNSVSSGNISGVALFEERRNGTTLVTMTIEGTNSGVDHPAHIHINSALEGGSITINFNNVSGATGLSVTSISAHNDGTPISYEQLTDFDGHIVVHKNTSDFSKVATGDIGENALTGESKSYDLAEIGSSGVSGSVEFAQRKSGFTLITIQLTGTPPGGDHPAHIHENSAASGGSVVLNFNNVNGDTGRSQTNVMQLNDGTSITYDQLINFNGHVIVHKSQTDFGTLLSRGNIGSNVN